MIQIKQKQSMKVISASVTDFSDALGYCEHKIPFYLKGIKAPPTPQTIQGSISHTAEEKYEQEHVKLVPVTEEQMKDKTANIEFQRERIFTRLLIPFDFEQSKVLVTLFGLADKVYRENKTLVVHDDKFTTTPKRYDSQTEPYLDQKLQVLTYLNSLYSNSRNSDPNEWFSIPHEIKEWKIQIKQHKKSEPYKVFHGIQSKEDLVLLHYFLDRFARLVLNLEQRQHHNLASKCRACRYVNQCEFKL